MYDFEYEKGNDGKRNKLCFYAWYVFCVVLSLGDECADRVSNRSPDNAKIKEKMVYASSKDALRRSLDGIATEIQGTDFSEVAYQESQSNSPFSDIFTFDYSPIASVSSRQGIPWKCIDVLILCCSLFVFTFPLLMFTLKSPNTSYFLFFSLSTFEIHWWS